MIITRTIGGKEIEIKLSEQELFDAFVEQERIWDVDYVTNESECDDRFDCITDEERTNTIEAIATEMRRRANKYGESDYDALMAAMDEYFEKLKEGKS